MRRWEFVSGLAGTLGVGKAIGAIDCDCGTRLPQIAAGTDPQPQPPLCDPTENPWITEVTGQVGSRARVSNMKVLTVFVPSGPPDRPYVLVKLETNVGTVGWGEATLEGKANAVAGCLHDLREYIIGSDPMQVEHHWQSMYVHSFYRGGPVIGSAIAGIDQALWDVRGKILGLPVYKLLGGPFDSRGVRGYYHAGAQTKEELAHVRETAVSKGITCLKMGPGARTFEWLDTNAKISCVIRNLQMAREVLGPDIDIAVDFHAKPSPTVASVILKEIEPLKLLFVEEPCPPENIKAMARISKRSTTPLATGERLITSYGCREYIEMGVVDILQPDINHVGGISALWKVAAMAEASGIAMAPHSCEGPIGSIATLHVDAAMPNFLVQETCRGLRPSARDKVWEEWFGFPVMRMAEGRFPLPQKPGLGVELSEDVLRRFAFSGSRPMTRIFHEDGSVAEW
jgi:galactonate dehydratase